LNASEYQERKSDAIIAAIGSAVLHLMIFLLCLWISYLGMQIVKDTIEAEAEKEVIVLLRPEQFEIEQPPEPAVPKEKKRKYVDSNPAIPETTAEEETKLIGDRNSLAASETALDEGAIDMPTQLTSNPPREETPVTYNSDFNDGEIANPATNSQQQASTTMANPGEDQVTEMAKATEADQIAPKVEIKSSANEREDLIESDNLVETPRDITEEKIKETESDLATKTTEINGEKEVTKTLPKETETAQEASEAGFSSEKTKTRIIGSLSRDGKSALNVKSTALGKYYSTISKIIEREWQKNCYKYREHIQPGVISMQFFIDKNGKITNPKPYDVVSTSEIQIGFTMKAIRKSTLPKMPKDAQNELGDEKLELIYNFYF